MLLRTLEEDSDVSLLLIDLEDVVVGRDSDAVSGLEGMDTDAVAGRILEEKGISVVVN